MENECIDLEPGYSTNEIAGKCIKCLAEQELSNCIIGMPGSDLQDNDRQRKYKILVAFLESPQSRELINETEQYLSEGKKVKVRLHFVNDSLTYEIDTK